VAAAGDNGLLRRAVGAIFVGGRGIDQQKQRHGFDTLISA